MVSVLTIVLRTSVVSFSFALLCAGWTTAVAIDANQIRWPPQEADRDAYYSSWGAATEKVTTRDRYASVLGLTRHRRRDRGCTDSLASNYKSVAEVDVRGWARLLKKTGQGGAGRA